MRGRGAKVAFAEIDSDHTRDSATRFFSLCDKSWSSLPVSRQSPANVRVGSGCAGSLGAFPFIAPTGGMEVQRPLEISKFGQSVGGGAGCVCAKNTSPRLGWRLHTQSRQGGKARVAAHLHPGSLTKPLQVSCTEPVPLTPTPTAKVTRKAQGRSQKLPQIELLSPHDRVTPSFKTTSGFGPYLDTPGRTLTYFQLTILI